MALKGWHKVSLCIGMVLFLAHGWIPPLNAGFYCDDPKIGHKFNRDSFPFAWLMTIAILPHVLMIYIGELFNLESSLSETTKGTSYQRCKFIMSQYLIGMTLSLTFNEIVKTLISEPRPHFIDTCRPDWKQIDCQQFDDGYVKFNVDLCTASNDPDNGVPRPLFDAVRSFPSGHAQLSCFAAVFGIIYLSKRRSFIPKVPSIVIHIMKLFFVAFALAASLTRITDRRHHWWDVLVGALLGGVTAFMTARRFCHDFQDKLLFESLPEPETNKKQS